MKKKNIIPSDCWITEVPTISTAHITLEDSEKLAMPDLFCDPDSNKWVMDLEYGWLFNLAEVPLDKFSDGMRITIRALIESGYKFVRLDQDGDTIDGLPTFDW